MACKYYINNKVLNEQEIKDLGFENLFTNSHFSYTEVLLKAKKYGEFIGTENLKHKTKNYIMCQNV